MDKKDFLSVIEEAETILINNVKADEYFLQNSGVTFIKNGYECFVGFFEILFGKWDDEEMILSDVECKTLAEKVTIEFMC